MKGLKVIGGGCKQGHEEVRTGEKRRTNTGKRRGNAVRKHATVPLSEEKTALKQVAGNDTFHWEEKYTCLIHLWSKWRLYLFNQTLYE